MKGYVMDLKSLFDRLTGRTEKYTMRLVAAFPKEFSGDARNATSLLPIFRREVLRSDGQVHYVDDGIHTGEYSVSLNSETIRLPTRLYFDELDSGVYGTLNEVQQTIVDCIYTRHHNGFVRQNHLKRLSGTSFDFVRPFVIQLLGEYVIEILYVVDKVIYSKTIDSYASFLRENPVYWKQTQSRVVSYWNEYYRNDFPSFDDYIGKQIVDRLNMTLANNQ